jgi:Lrp/AsnC family transcriptional regulator for asnA, asnC and gidA
MIRDGVIEVRAVANPRAVGYTTLADVRLQVDAESVRDVAARMVEYACVTYVAYAIGETDVSLQVVGRDTAEVYRFISEVAGQMAGVRKTTTSIVPRVLKDVYQWRFPDDACINDEQN